MFELKNLSIKQNTIKYKKSIIVNVQFPIALSVLAIYPPEHSRGPQDVSNLSCGNPKEHVAELLSFQRGSSSENLLYSYNLLV